MKLKKLMSLLTFYNSLKREPGFTYRDLYAPILILGIYAVIYTLLPMWIFPSDIPLMLSPQVFFLAAVCTALVIERNGLCTIGLCLKNIKRDLKVAAVAIAVPTTASIAIIGPILIYKMIQMGSLKAAVTGSPILYTYADMARMIILAPISEEMLFRGYLIPPLERELTEALTNKISSAKTRTKVVMILTAVISAVIFTLAHGGIKPGPLALGLGAAWIYLKTGSILPAILLHAYCNAWGPLLSYYAPGVFDYLKIFYA